MKYKVPQVKPYVNEEELKNLQEVIRSAWLTEGPFSVKFIDQIKQLTQAKYALLACNGTLALYLANLAVGVSNDDEVIVPVLTFNASASSICFANGKPVFVDINNTDLNIDVKKIEAAITSKTKAIMPVHLYGQSCDMDPILNIAKKYNLKIVEDAAQGLGVYYKGTHTGTMGDAGVISFFSDKTITTGEGAVILTNDETIYKKLTWLRNQGREHSGTFIHPELGMNFRMTDLQCAVGVAQMAKFKEIENRKIKHYELYKHFLDNVKQIRFIQLNNYSNFLPFRVNIRAEKLEGLIEFLESKQIQTRKTFYPLHRQPCFKYLNYKTEEFPIANLANDEVLSLPVFTELTEEQIKYTCDTIRDYYEG